MICVRKECRAEFEPSRRHQIYCSAACRWADHNQRRSKPLRLTGAEVKRIEMARCRAEKRVPTLRKRKATQDTSKGAPTPLGANPAISRKPNRATMAAKARKSGVHRFDPAETAGSSEPERQEPCEPLMVTSEVARMLRVSEWTVRYWRMRKVRSGPPFIKIGRLVRYFRRDVMRFARKHRIMLAGRSRPGIRVEDDGF